MDHQRYLHRQRRRRAWRVRKRVRGSAERPRLSVFRSLKHIYAQVIDDEAGRTLVSASTCEAEFSGGKSATGNKNAATHVGKALAERALAAGLKHVSFDRGSCKYHGRIAALAEAARTAGLEF